MGPSRTFALTHSPESVSLAGRSTVSVLRGRPVGFGLLTQAGRGTQVPIGSSGFGASKLSRSPSHTVPGPLREIGPGAAEGPGPRLESPTQTDCQRASVVQRRPLSLSLSRLRSLTAATAPAADSPLALKVAGPGRWQQRRRRRRAVNLNCKAEQAKVPGQVRSRSRSASHESDSG